MLNVVIYLQSGGVLGTKDRRFREVGVELLS